MRNDVNIFNIEPPKPLWLDNALAPNTASGHAILRTLAQDRIWDAYVKSLEKRGGRLVLGYEWYPMPERLPQPDRGEDE
jgi:hypothetical protein